MAFQSISNKKSIKIRFFVVFYMGYYKLNIKPMTTVLNTGSHLVNHTLNTDQENLKIFQNWKKSKIVGMH